MQLDFKICVGKNVLRLLFNQLLQWSLLVRQLCNLGPNWNIFVQIECQAAYRIQEICWQNWKDIPWHVLNLLTQQCLENQKLMCFWYVGSTRWKSTRQSEVLMAFLWPLVDLLHLRPQGHAVPDWAPISHCVRPHGFHFTPSSWWMVPPCTPPPPPTHQRPPNSEPRLPWAWATHLKPPTNNTISRQPSKGHASYGNLPWSNQSWASYISFVLVHVYCMPSHITICH